MQGGRLRNYECEGSILIEYNRTEKRKVTADDGSLVVGRHPDREQKRQKRIKLYKFIARNQLVFSFYSKFARKSSSLTTSCREGQRISKREVKDRKRTRGLDEEKECGE